MRNLAKTYQVELNENVTYGLSFQQLIRDTADKHQQQVVILVDEYDKPILDNITNLDIAIELREMIKGLYVCIKSNDAYLKFVLLT